MKYAAFGLTVAAASLQAQLVLNPISTIQNGDPSDLFDESAAEIVSFDSVTDQMYVVNGATDSIDIFDISDPELPALVTSVDLSSYGNPNSVDVNPTKEFNEVAVAVGAGEADQKGTVVILTKDGEIIADYEVGYLPDMLTYDSKGRRIVVANEGEPNDDYTFDPEGSVSILQRRSKGYRVSNVSFAGIEEEDLNGARISGPEGTTIAQDLEPEFVTIGPNDRFAYVACQENNAIVTVNIPRRRVVGVYGLGSKDHSQIGNALDVSNKDDAIRIANWPINGLYMPDSISSYTFRKATYIVTANEGDGRDYDGFVDESRVKDLEEDFGLTLDPSSFPLADALVLSENLGRLKVIVTEGNLDDDETDLEQLYSYGARSFSIFNAETGELIYDSGDFMETYLAKVLPEGAFNSTNDEDDSFDNRSDDKGPEPEAIALGKILGKTYAFVGLERVGGIMIFDITNPEEVSFQSYYNNRDFSVDFANEIEDELVVVSDEALIAAGDLGPEGIEFIPASKSPNRKNLLLVANEVSGTTTIYEISEGRRQLEF